MFRCALPASFLLFTVCLVTGLAQQQDAPTKSAFQTNPKKWDDLPATGKDWKRVALTPKAKLPGKSPWRFGTGDTISSSATTTPEMLLYNASQTNGIFHFEWRTPKEATAAYGNGVFVRTAGDGAVWHLAYAGSKTAGSITGNSLLDKKPIRVDPKKTQLPGPPRLKEPGEWNVTEVTAKDKTVSIWVNGYVVAEWAFCDVPKGYIGLRSEAFPLEYRNLKHKKLR